MAQTPALELIDQAILDVAEGRNQRLIISMPPQEGKALALDTPIATPSGWTALGDLRVGEVVFDRHGDPCHVTWLSPVQTGRPCCAVTTGDGERIVADAAHEWIARLDRRSSERVVETSLLAQARSKNAQITGPSGLTLPDADLPLDPYVLGAWLGDGSARSAEITSADPEIIERIRSAGTPCRKRPGQPYAYSLAPEGSTAASPVRKALVALRVWGDKHIPDLYQRSSTAQRLALLQGLIDTDGHVIAKGQVEFCNTNLRLAEGVRDLVFSLGAKAVLTTERARLQGRDCGPKYRVRFYLAEAASLPRKANRCRDSSVARIRYVTAQPIESVPVRCIEVDSPTHTYLAGRTLLPTHNSERVTHYGVLWLLRRNPDLRVGLVSYGEDIARRFSYLVRGDITTFTGAEGSIDLGLKLRGDSGAAGYWNLAAPARGGVYAIGVGGGLTGRPLDLVVIDDPVKDYRAADSPLLSELAWQWWQSVARPRLAPDAPVIVILTRWHENDLAGRLLAKQAEDEASGLENFDRWRVINIPAEADHDPERGQTDPLGREPGEFMLSARGRTEAQWKATKAATAPRIWTALYQGKPSPEQGDVLKRHWWRRYETPIWGQQPDGSYWIPECDEVAQSWDMTFKDTKASDMVTGQVWVRRGAMAYMVDQIRGRLSFTASLASFRLLTKRWPQSTAKLIEDKANGPAVIDSLKKEIPGIIPIEPHGSKYARAAAVSPFVESGNVLLPDRTIALFDVEAFIEETASFPNASHDDQVDGMSQMLDRWFLGGRRGADFVEFMRRQAAARAADVVPAQCPKRREGHLWREGQCAMCGAPAPVAA